MGTVSASGLSLPGSVPYQETRVLRAKWRSCWWRSCWLGRGLSGSAHTWVRLGALCVALLCSPAQAQVAKDIKPDSQPTTPVCVCGWLTPRDHRVHCLPVCMHACLYCMYGCMHAGRHDARLCLLLVAGRGAPLLGSMPSPCPDEVHVQLPVQHGRGAEEAAKQGAHEAAHEDILPREEQPTDRRLGAQQGGFGGAEAGDIVVGAVSTWGGRGVSGDTLIACMHASVRV